MNTVKVEFASGTSEFSLKFNLDEIVEALKDKDFANCAECKGDVVAWAFEKWIEAFLEELEENPQWYLNQGNTNVFKKHLYGKPKTSPPFAATRENLRFNEAFRIMQAEESFTRESVSAFNEF